MGTYLKPLQVVEGTPLWEPSVEEATSSNIARYMDWLEETRGLTCDSYQRLWEWSVSDIEAFWASIWQYFKVKTYTPYSRVLDNHNMPGARWFPGTTLNYAEHMLTRKDAHFAIIARSEARAPVEITYAELHRQVASCAAGLRRLGLKRGDRVVAYMPNIPEAVIAMLATASLGAIWSSCSPEFGVRSVVDRFRQIGPKVLIAIDGYRYGGKDYPKTAMVADIQHQLPSLSRTVLVPYLTDGSPSVLSQDTIAWRDLLKIDEAMVFERVPFDHPLWVLYSSGTTGLPKPIVHGHGGILLEHLKALSLHMDLSGEDRFFWFTTTGWMMWNYLVGGLALGSTLVLFDGSPAFPDMNALWRLAADTGTTYFGTSASFIQACMKAGVLPARSEDLSRIKAIGSTGSPLSIEGFNWLYQNVKNDMLIGSFSGGTDVCTGFVGPCPLLPVRAGEIQCRCLGAKIEAFDSEGRSVTGQVGELVLTEPLPSMPLFFWNDTGGQRYRESYFETFPGVWRHGDWVKITGHGSCILSGRSDSTLKRGGIRMGTSEFYRIIEEMEEVIDSLVIDTGEGDREGQLLLFLVLKEGYSLDDSLRQRIRDRIRSELSPRHIPDAVYVIPKVPRTLNGKKLEVPVKRILLGASVEKSVNPSSLADPASLHFFVEMVKGQ